MAKSLAEQELPRFVIAGVDSTLDPYLKLRAHGAGLCSPKMRSERRQFILLMVAQLWQLGFRIRKLESLTGKHVRALVNYWHEQGIIRGTLDTRLSMINVLCNWLGKTNIVQDITAYLPDEEVRRDLTNKKSKAWDTKNVNPLDIIRLASQIDERMAAMLALQHHFGLRVKESVEIRPDKAISDDGKTLRIQETTKGGRIRQIPIQTPEQVNAIEWAHRLAATGKTKRLRWPDCSTWVKAQNRFYNLARKRLGITGKRLGITSHGLRYGYAKCSDKNEIGYPTPIEGSTIGMADREAQRMTSLNLSRQLGLGRIDVTTGYFGSYGHPLCQSAPVTMTYQFKMLPNHHSGQEPIQDPESGSGL